MTKNSILNSDEIDAWLFNHAQLQGHVCESVKGIENNENVAWVDVVTGEQIEVLYETKDKDE